MDRREFVKITAVSGASATLAGCGNPENQLIRFVPEEQLIPGVSTLKPGVCNLCPAACGMQVKVMEGDVEVVRNGQLGLMTKSLAKKLDGNPEHPISQGKLCVRGQAAIQVTYHPDRITEPLKRSGERGSGKFEPVSWEEALTELTTELDRFRQGGKEDAMRFLTKPLSGGRQKLVRAFLASFGAPSPVTFEVFSDQLLRQANAASFGFEQLPTLDLANSRYLIGFGADFLGTWNSPVAQNVAYGKMRKGRPGVRAKFVQVESRMSQTGANADEWVPANVGTEGVLALGIAKLIMDSGHAHPDDAGNAGKLIDGWSDGLPAYAPNKVEEITGVNQKRLSRLAREFAENQPSVAVIGGAPLAQTNGLFHALAVNALNALLGSVQTPGGVLFTPAPEGFGRSTDNETTLAQFVDEIREGGDSSVKVLFVNDTNPVFGAPPAWGFTEALLNVPYIVSFGQFLDETNSLADLILPDHSLLETWIDAVPESGTSFSTVSMAPPAMRPLHDTRPMPDVLLELSRSLSRPLDSALPWQDYQDVLQEMFEKLAANPEEPGDLWVTAQEQGGWWEEFPVSSHFGLDVKQMSANFEEAEFDGEKDLYPFHFLPFASQAFLDGSLAHLPWLQELPDVLSTAMWSTWLEINPSTAEGMGVKQGDLMEVASSQGSLRAPAFISPAIAPDVIAMPVGQGHESFTRYASGRGVNPISILAPLEETSTGEFAWAATRVQVSKVDGDGELILYGGALEEHVEHSR